MTVAAHMTQTGQPPAKQRSLTASFTPNLDDIASLLLCDITNKLIRIQGLMLKKYFPCNKRKLCNHLSANLLFLKTKFTHINNRNFSYIKNIHKRYKKRWFLPKIVVPTIFKLNRKKSYIKQSLFH